MRIKGVVRRSADGRPLQGARVAIFVDGTERASVPTDEEGCFEYMEEGTPSGQALICRAEKKGFEAREAVYPLDGEEFSVQIDLGQQAIPLDIVVKDEKGRPLELIRISLAADRGVTEVLATDQHGLASVELDADLEGHEIHYTIVGPGCAPAEGDLELERGANLQVTMRGRGRLAWLGMANWDWGKGRSKNKYPGYAPKFESDLVEPSEQQHGRSRSHAVYSASEDRPETARGGDAKTASHSGAGRWWTPGKWNGDKARVAAAVIVVVAVGYFAFRDRPIIIDSFEVQPAQIEQDSPATLTWEISNAGEVTLNGQGVPTSGSTEVRPKQTTEYTLVAHNNRGEAQRTVTVEVSVPEELTEALVRQFMKVYTELRDSPIGDEVIKSGGPADFLAATGPGNELIPQGCRQGAVDFAVETLRVRQEIEDERRAEQMFSEHMQDQRQAMSHATYREIFQHIVECEDYCRPWFSQLLQCHVLSVAESNPEIVLFATGSRTVAASYSQGILSEVAERAAQDAAARIWLMGRASNIGSRDDNRALSFARAASVKEALVNKGVSPARIEILAFGYEPPQISLQVAKQYSMEELYLTKGEQYLNQSVVVVF